MIFSILVRDTALVPRRDLLFIPPDLPLFSLFSELSKESLTWLNGCNCPHNWTQRVPTRKSRDLESSWDTGWAQPSSCVPITKLCWCLWKGLPSGHNDGSELLLSIAFFYQPRGKNRFEQKAGKGEPGHHLTNCHPGSRVSGNNSFSLLLSSSG